MRISHAVAALSVCIVACSSGVAVAAIRSGQPPTPSVARPVGSTVDTGAAETLSVAITPCRIIDTRLGGGPMKGGAPRAFHATGSTGFAAQGGSSTGCGIPAGAASVNVALQSTNSSGTGHINETPYGSPFPLASLGHYVKGQTIGTGSSFTLATSGSYDFSLIASAGQTDVIVDVLGYSTRSMSAFVLGDGTVVHSSRETSATHISLGRYEIDFDRDISMCSYAVTAYTGGEVTAEPRLATPDGVYVELFDSAGTLNADGDFYLTVTC